MRLEDRRIMNRRWGDPVAKFTSTALALAFTAGFVFGGLLVGVFA